MYRLVVNSNSVDLGTNASEICKANIKMAVGWGLLNTLRCLPCKTASDIGYFVTCLVISMFL